MSQTVDLTENECKKAFANGSVVYVQAHPHDMSIIFFTNTSDKGYVITKKGGAVKRFKSNFDRDMVISIIKGN